MTLSRTEERAEMALFMAQHPTTFCSCGSRFVFCRYDLPACPVRPAPFADIIDQLIERGRIVR